MAGTPTGSAWFWGGCDELGRLNLLTPSRTQAAAHECIKSGTVVSLDHPQPSTSTVEDAARPPLTSRWLSFRSAADPHSGCFYNGVVLDELLPNSDELGETEEYDCTSNRLSVDAWARHGIVGRGVLLDVCAWAEENGIKTKREIAAEDLKACAASEGVVFQMGDILLVRMGFLSLGLASSDEMKDFLHDNYFTAIAVDAATLDASTPAHGARETLRQSLIPLWGMPVGVLWDLESLGQTCKMEQRWSFFLSSKPGIEPEGAANAMAIF